MLNLIKLKIVRLLSFYTFFSLITWAYTNPNINPLQEVTTARISSINEEHYDIIEDSIVFKSAAIENFDYKGNSIDIYWIDNNLDTILKFFRIYDSKNNLIGAKYYEEDETIPNKDSIYYNSDGLKVEASLNAQHQITWKSITSIDSNGNPVLKTYENGKGEYCGLDSLFFDDQNRVIKGFYKNGKGKKYGVKTYEYIEYDKKGNWVERLMNVDEILKQKQIRIIKYYD